MTSDRGPNLPEESGEAQPYVPRRKIPVRIRLVGHEVIRGGFYAELWHADGSPGRVLERLNDTTERYLPIAVGGRHLLLGKEHIVSVDLDGDEVDRPVEIVRAIRVRMGLSVGSAIEGTILSPERPGKNMRTLDYLNGFSETFHCVRAENSVSLVNGRYVASVTELHDHEPLID